MLMRIYNIEIKTVVKQLRVVFTYVFFVALFCTDVYAQYPVAPTAPRAAAMQPNNAVIYGTPLPQPVQPNAYQHSYGNSFSIHEQNARLMQEVYQHQLQLQQQNEQLREALEEFEPRQGVNIAVCKSTIPMPDFSAEAETEYFHNAFNEINKMLTGEVPISLKDAVFLSENAFFGNRMSYMEYNNKIQESAELCRAKMRQEGLNHNDNLVKNMMAFHYITDTLTLQLPDRLRQRSLCSRNT